MNLLEIFGTLHFTGHFSGFDYTGKALVLNNLNGFGSISDVTQRTVRNVPEFEVDQFYET